MPCLIANLPSYEVWVRKEYLTDHQSGHGEFVKGVWVSVKSMPGRAFYFETYLPEYAAMYDKLTLLYLFTLSAILLFCFITRSRGS